jgi:leucine dehydrogenase
VGHVGEHLVRLLKKEGAVISISDINQEKLKELNAETGASIVEVGNVYDVDMDIYAPCALGGTVNSDTLPKLKCSIIAGAANNQLWDEELHGNMCKEKGIIWAPDFLINAGGLMNVYSELHGYNREKALAQAEKIYDLTGEILKKAKSDNITTIQAAKTMAKQRIANKLAAGK